MSSIYYIYDQVVAYNLIGYKSSAGNFFQVKFFRFGLRRAGTWTEHERSSPLKNVFSREHASQKPSKRYYEALNASYVHRMANFEQTKYTFKMTSQFEVGF